MTPFGERLRKLRASRNIQLKQMAFDLHVSAAYLSGLEHGKRGRPGPGFVMQIANYFELIWDEVDQLKELLIFFTGLSCSPDNIRIEFSSYNSFFKGHLCSNGLDIPLTSGYKSSPIEQYDTKEKLKTALLNSLAFKQ